jgi:hypothetical protein
MISSVPYSRYLICNVGLLVKLITMGSRNERCRRVCASGLERPRSLSSKYVATDTNH